MEDLQVVENMAIPVFYRNAQRRLITSGQGSLFWELSQPVSPATLSLPKGLMNKVVTVAEMEAIIGSAT